MISRRALAPFLALAFPAHAQLLNPGAPTLAARDGLIGPDQPPPGPEALAWQAAVVTNGGTVSAARLQIVQNFIAAEMSAGTWALTDDYWPLWGENVPQALTSLKQRRLAVSVSAPSFTADRGYTFDGVASYINSGFIPSTHAVAMTNGNGRLAIYDRLNTTSTNVAAGCQAGSTVSIYMTPRSGTTARSRMLEADLITPTLPVADSRGYMAISRAGTATVKTYKTGAPLADGTGITLAATLPTFSLYLGGVNSSGTATLFRNCALGFACIGAPLGDALEAAQYANVQAWATAIGAQV